MPEKQVGSLNGAGAVVGAVGKLRAVLFKRGTLPGQLLRCGNVGPGLPDSPRFLLKKPRFFM